MNDDIKKCEESISNLNTPQNIVQKDTRYYSYVHIPEMFLGFVIGKKKVSKLRIERETETVITLPESGNDDSLTICGKSFKSVSEALNKISSLVAIVREKTVLTHFLSIKATTETVKSSFLKFKSNVLEQCSGEYGVSEMVFQKDYKLHITLCIVVLADKNEIINMNDVCRQFQNDNASLFSSPINVHLRGLESFNSNNSKVRVLYAKVEPSGERDRLQTIANRMVDYLLARGVINRREYDSVTLHMTLMNVSFSIVRGENQSRFSADNVIPKTIDCSKIFEKFADWDFGDLCVDEVELSRSNFIDEGSFYQNDGVMKFHKKGVQGDLGVEEAVPNKV